MMDDIEKTKPVAEAPADDDETGAGCDVCMPPRRRRAEFFLVGPGFAVPFERTTPAF